MGYSQTELDDVQARWGLRFPPDLVELLLKRRPLIDWGDCFDWVTAEPDVIKKALAWPFEGYWARVRDAGYWWPEWGEKPESASEQRARLRNIFDDAPRLIPLAGHRYIPEEPNESGNPVFSVFGADIIYYGTRLSDWLERETGGGRTPWPSVKEIRFWSQAVRYANDLSAIRRFNFEREFQVWLYTVSHAQLLLRSTRAGKHGTRVDILFKGVRAVQLPTTLRGLNIVVMSRHEAIETSTSMGVQLRGNESVFALSGSNYAGFVIAGGAFLHEDEGSHDDPSYFAASFMPRNQP
jgi:hypothetical protein